MIKHLKVKFIDCLSQIGMDALSAPEFLEDINKIKELEANNETN